MTLATKQPAMTAATIAKTLKDDEKNKNKYDAIADLMVRLSRSQFIAFVGNVFMAFPVALLLIACLLELSGYNMATKKAHHLLEDLHPLDSPAMFHAAIAGVFLFISGLIAGNVDNSNIYNKTALRITEHPALKFFISEKWRLKLAGFYSKNAGGIISNFWFGVFMGCTGIIGTILGLNIDIRHITFASGNLALGIFGENFHTEISVILWSILGIGLIGFVNFIVSFTLSLMLALRSRGIPLSELRHINAVVSKKFFNNPLPFFFPPSERQKPD
jgi:site-specific recombinase